jgi:hypothetical protein
VAVQPSASDLDQNGGPAGLLGLILESDKPDDGDRIYRIVASTSGKAEVKPNPDRQGA